jgi:hypothetical protein
MKSIVLDLQQAAMDSSASVAELLRKAMTVARKLAIREMQEQLAHEMNGYPADAVLPQYRTVHGQIKAWNPYHGWIPIMVQDAKTADRLTIRSVHQPIGELEVLANSEGKGALQMTLPTQVQNWVMEGLDIPLQPILHISKTQIHRIVDAVRNAILEWSLKLEEQGILGEGLTFTSEEKEKAVSVVYNIQSVTGVVGGNVSAETIQIGSYNSIHQQLKDLGVSQVERNELEIIMDSLPESPPAEKKTLIQRGLEWVE